MATMSWLKMTSLSGISSQGFGMLEWLKIIQSIPKAHVCSCCRGITTGNLSTSCGEFRGTRHHQRYW